MEKNKVIFLSEWSEENLSHLEETKTLISHLREVFDEIGFDEAYSRLLLNEYFILAEDPLTEEDIKNIENDIFEGLGAPEEAKVIESIEDMVQEIKNVDKIYIMLGYPDNISPQRELAIEMKELEFGRANGLYGMRIYLFPTTRKDENEYIQGKVKHMLEILSG